MNEFNVNLNPCQMIRNHSEFKVLKHLEVYLSTTKDLEKNVQHQLKI